MSPPAVLALVWRGLTRMFQPCVWRLRSYILASIDLLAFVYLLAPIDVLVSLDVLASIHLPVCLAFEELSTRLATRCLCPTMDDQE